MLTLPRIPRISEGQKRRGALLITPTQSKERKSQHRRRSTADSRPLKPTPTDSNQLLHLVSAHSPRTLHGACPIESAAGAPLQFRSTTAAPFYTPRNDSPTLRERCLPYPSETVNKRNILLHTSARITNITIEHGHRKRTRLQRPTELWCTSTVQCRG